MKLLTIAVISMLLLLTISSIAFGAGNLGSEIAWSINVTNVGMPYEENVTPMVAFLNFSSFGTKPYNESVRITNKACGSSGFSELPSGIFLPIQNATGHMNSTWIAILHNGTVTSNIRYCFEANYTVTVQQKYNTNFNAKSASFKNNWFEDNFSAGAINKASPVGFRPSEVNNWVIFSYWDGMTKLGTDILTASLGSTALISNMSNVVAVFNSSSGADYNIHIYVANSVYKILQMHSASIVSTDQGSAPNASTSNWLLYSFNTTNSSQAEITLPLLRGITCETSSVLNLSSCLVWRNKNNDSHAQIAGTTVLRGSIGTNFAGGVDVPDNNSFAFRGWVNGLTSLEKANNASKLWNGLVDNKLIFTFDPAGTAPNPPNATNLTIRPTPAYNNSVLNASVLVFTDALTVAVNFTWFKNAAVSWTALVTSNGNNTNVTNIGNLTLSTGDNISVKITLSDSFGTYSNSTGNITIQPIPIPPTASGTNDLWLFLVILAVSIIGLLYMVSH